MKRVTKSLCLLLTLVAIILSSSCNNGKTYSQKLQEERDAIDRFLNEAGYTIVESFPTQWNSSTNKLDTLPMPEKQFIRLPGIYVTSESIYFRLINKGDNQRVSDYTKIQLRQTNGTSLLTGQLLYENSFGGQPIEFTKIAFATNACEGFIIPLTFMGSGSEAEMIVPSKLGKTNEKTYTVDAVHYDKIKYTFY